MKGSGIAGDRNLATRDGQRIKRIGVHAVAGLWVTGEALPAQGGQTIDAFTEIDELDGQEDPHVGSNLDHVRWRRKVCIRATRSFELQ